MSRIWPGAVSTKAGHGTRAGFQMHKAMGIAVCGPCREAQNKYMADYMRAHYDPAKRRARYLASKERG